MSRQTGCVGTGTESASGQDRFECLYANAHTVMTRQENIRNTKVEKECTFKPERVGRRKDEGKCGKERMEMLYEDAKRIKMKVRLSLDGKIYIFLSNFCFEGV